MKGAQQREILTYQKQLEELPCLEKRRKSGEQDWSVSNHIEALRGWWSMILWVHEG